MLQCGERTEDGRIQYLQVFNGWYAKAEKKTSLTTINIMLRKTRMKPNT
jgi:hypothetical protein